jgi:hypothetical protein
VSVSFFTSKVQPIFTGECAACHGTASGFNANLALSSGNAYAHLFSGTSPIAAHEHAASVRVQPGSSSAGYLYRKVEGTHGSLPAPFTAPGPGVRMPQGCSPGTSCLDVIDTDGDGTVDAAELQFWIDNLGAPGP